MRDKSPWDPQLLVLPVGIQQMPGHELLKCCRDVLVPEVTLHSAVKTFWSS